MKRFWMTGLGLAGLLLGAGAALAEPGDFSAKLDTRIDMTLSKAAPDDLFKTFAKMFGAEAVVDPGVREPVSIELHNVSARTLLDTICESIGCRWSLEPGSPPKLRVLPVPAAGPGKSKPSALRDPIDLKVAKADGQDLLRTFGEILGAELAVDPGIKGELTLNLDNTPVDQALDVVCRALGCDWTYTEDANGKKPVLRIAPRSKRK
jgi:type II secretory pathway component GspD/PulD (secretin)